MTAVDEIKPRIDIVDLVSETVKLRRSGKNYTGFCPFHANTRTPAFVVFPDSGTWRCFGQCNEGGDIFRFVMKKEGWDFAETLRYLAERAGVQLEAANARATGRKRKRTTRLRGLLEDAVNFYRHHLHPNPGGKPALEYLHKRGLTPATIEAFGLGYAPACLGEPPWITSPRRAIRPMSCSKPGWSPSARKAAVFYDRFRNRIMFPIRDGMGSMAGFGARILDPE